MPITKSAEKALRQSVRRRVQNIKKKTAFKDAVKSVRKAVSAGKIDEAKKLLPAAFKTLDKAAKTHVITKNTASRLKSRLSKSIARIATK